MSEIDAIKAELKKPITPVMRRLLQADLSRAIGEASRAAFMSRSSERMAIMAGNDRPWLVAVHND